MTSIAELQEEVLKFPRSQPDLATTDDIWHTTYHGAPAIQAWQDFMLWERFLNLASDAGRMVEIGTFVGGFSLYLLDQCRSRAMTFNTIDFQIYVDYSDPKFTELERHFLHLDVFMPEGLATIQSLIDTRIGTRKMILLCDGGNKPKEMQIFVPMLHAGDYAAVHDWGNEIGEADLESVKHMLDPVMMDECEKLHSLTRFFRRI